MSILVFKFGGSSVKDAVGVTRIKNILESHKEHKLVVVISAMGKTTNALEEVHKIYLKDPDQGLARLDDVIEKHLDIAEALGMDRDVVSRTLHPLIVDNLMLSEGSKDSDLLYDQIISLGELFSTTIITQYLKHCNLNAKWMDVRNVILTDGTHREARVDFAITKNKITKKVKRYTQSADLIITQGFIGKTKEGFTTTLGREGSDYTAAIMAYALGVDELIIWKDVPGILTGDPRRFKDATLLEKLSYREAIEMTFFGAKVIHPKTIQPIQNKGIQLKVKSFLNPEAPGTLIADPGADYYPPIIVIEDDVVLLHITSNDFSFISENHLSLIFDKMNKHKLKLSVMRNSAISFMLCVTKVDDVYLAAFLKDLGDEFTVDLHKNLQLITVRHFNQSLVDSLTSNKEILFEETLRNTIQLVVRSVEA